MDFSIFVSSLWLFGHNVLSYLRGRSQISGCVGVTRHKAFEQTSHLLVINSPAWKGTFEK